MERIGVSFYLVTLGKVLLGAKEPRDPRNEMVTSMHPYTSNLLRPESYKIY